VGLGLDGLEGLGLAVGLADGLAVGLLVGVGVGVGGGVGPARLIASQTWSGGTPAEARRVVPLTRSALRIVFPPRAATDA
jgi:hypothetical protein